MVSSFKYCTKCSESKLVGDFYKDSTKKDSCSFACKSCTKSRQKHYNIKNRDNISKQNRKYYKEHIEAISEYNRHYRKENKEAVTEYQRIYQNINKERIQQQNREYHKDYYAKNKPAVLSRNITRSKLRYKTDSLFALRKIMASRMCGIFKLKGIKKQHKTEQLLGCNSAQLRDYLENIFESWMTWENRGLCNGEPNYGWDVDHIIPLSSATTEEELVKLCHYSNLQPLCSYTNRYIKRDIY